jgi:diphosphomevalonate decarboxylase
VIEASAPSNIALIKYMGKSDLVTNRPANSSLSWTMENLRTFVQLELNSLAQDKWAPLKKDGVFSIELSEKGKQKFLKHFQFLKNQLGIIGNFTIRSGSNFPSDCGLASSASSFAALTLAAHKLAESQKSERADVTLEDLAGFSQRGSGSSCRSFFGPFALWYEEGVRPLDFPIMNLSHCVVVLDEKVKEVSSSEAHKRVITSSLFDGRPARAEKRLADLMEAFRQKDWAKAFEVCWAEFWDMHALFETSEPSFGYMRPETLQVLSKAKALWKESGDGPLVTMDAGPNVHFLFREDQSELKQSFMNELKSQYQVLESPQLG